MAKTEIKIKLLGEDGNAFAILARCRQALFRAKRLDLWDEFYKEATASNYHHLIYTVFQYFLVDQDIEEGEEW